MKTKVGQTYRTYDDTRKRETPGVVWSLIWTFLLVGWTAFMLIVSFRTGFWSLPIGDIIMLFLVCNFPTAIFGAGCYFTIKDSEHVRTMEFLIHTYESWNFRLSKYDTFYLTEQVTLNANYTFHKHTGDHVDKMSQQELEDYCKGLPEEYCSFVGYTTQEEAMKDILSTIKSFIANDKASENIKIKNVSTLETFTTNELKEKFANGEFNHLYETKTVDEDKPKED
jgi:hypothetical protein